MNEESVSSRSIRDRALGGSGGTGRWIMDGQRVLKAAPAPAGVPVQVQGVRTAAPRQPCSAHSATLIRFSRSSGLRSGRRGCRLPTATPRCRPERRARRQRAAHLTPHTRRAVGRPVPVARVRRAHLAWFPFGAGRCVTGPDGSSLSFVSLAGRSSAAARVSIGHQPAR